jgi:hypothetical protein
MEKVTDRLAEIYIYKWRRSLSTPLGAVQDNTAGMYSVLRGVFHREMIDQTSKRSSTNVTQTQNADPQI